MTKRTKNFFLAAVSVCLLLGGTIWLMKDGVMQKKADERLEPFKPMIAVQKQLDDISDGFIAVSTAPVSEYSEDANINPTEVYSEFRASVTLPDETVHSLMDSAKTLKDSYPDVIGWLYIPDTSINYPIMQSSDNDYYLSHSFDGKKLKSGSVFLDSRCEGRFMNQINILYAHNMRNGSMFAGIEKYKDEAFFENHRYGWLATAESVYRLDFFAAAVVGCEDRIYDGSANITGWIPRIEDKSVVLRDMVYSDNDRFIMLSTCSYEFKNARTVLAGKMVYVNGG